MELILRKEFGGLVADNQDASEYLHGIGSGKTVYVTIKDPNKRSTKQLRWYMVFLHKVFDSQDFYKDFEKMRYMLSLKIGSIDHIEDRNGTTYIRPKSIAIGSMESAEFTALVNKTKRFVRDELAPNMTDEDMNILLNELGPMLD